MEKNDKNNNVDNHNNNYCEVTIMTVIIKLPMNSIDNSNT